VAEDPGDRAHRRSRENDRAKPAAVADEPQEDQHGQRPGQCEAEVRQRHGHEGEAGDDAGDAPQRRPARPARRGSARGRTREQHNARTHHDERGEEREQATFRAGRAGQAQPPGVGRGRGAQQHPERIDRALEHRGG
jgi:hypothetical protein